MGLSWNGTRRGYVGLNSSGEIEVGSDLSQTFRVVGGGMTVSGALSASNLSGTNTGDQDLSGYVTLSGTQTITGQKTLSREAVSYGGTVQSFLIDGAGGNGSLTINSASAYAYLNFAQTGTTKMEIGIVGTAGARYGSLYINRNI
jgi:hypothetical protein